MSSNNLPANYEELSHEDRGPELLGVLWTFCGLAIIVVALKIYARFRIMKAEGVDDALILLSLAMAIATTSIFTYSVTLGFGRHIWTLDPQDTIKSIKYNYMAVPPQILAYSIPKISVAIFIDRILAPSKIRRIILYGVPGLQLINGVIAIIVLFKTCTPTASIWDPAVPQESCLPHDPMLGYNYFVAAFTAFTDFFLAIVPIMSFINLQMERSSKIAVSILMGVTAVGGICAIVKTTKLWQLNEPIDFTYATGDLTITSTVEGDMIIIAACVPTLRPLFKSIKESITSARSSKNQTGSSGKRSLPQYSQKQYSHEQYNSNPKSQSWIKLSHANSNPAFVDRSRHSQDSETYGLQTLQNPGSNDIVRQTVVTTGTETV
ncbi:MAG: hypothetical protein M1831_005664 [Alyxoria varia]|nr:MAG: hypothetical protein M1831_005664 [Alyxoria varia]